MAIAQIDTIKLLIIEENALVRLGMVDFFNKNPSIHIVGQASTGQSAMEMICLCQPDVVTLDFTLPDIDGLELAQKIKAENANTKILVTTFQQEEDQIIAALLAGIDAYCLKDSFPEHLSEVIRIVCSGGAWLDPIIVKKLISILQSRELIQKKTLSFKNIGLTERESKILSLIVRGKNNANIAKELSVSYHTIKSDVTHILSKLSVPDRVQAAVKALKENLV